MSNKVRGKKDERRKKEIAGHSASILNTLASGRHILIQVPEPKTHLHSDASQNMKTNVGKVSFRFVITDTALFLLLLF